MLEITRFETRRRIRGAVYLSISLLAYAGLVVGIFPSVEAAGADIESYIEALPPEIRQGFVGDAESFTTIEGFLSTEMYQFVIVLILGMYFAYAMASAIAGEISDESIDLLLVHPISRTQVIVGKFLSVIPVLVIVSAVMFVGTWAAVDFIGERIDLVNLFMMHLLSIPYLLACAAFGMLASVLLDGPRRAQTVGAGGIFGMFLVDTITYDREYEFLGDLAFSRYFSVSDVLVNGEYDYGGMMLLVMATIVLVIVSAEYFERKDIG